MLLAGTLLTSVTLKRSQTDTLLTTLNLPLPLIFGLYCLMATDGQQFSFYTWRHCCARSSLPNTSLDIWVKRDQLDATCFIITLFSAQHVSDVNTSILRSLRLIRWITSLVVSGSMCVGVTLQCAYGGVVSVCRLKLQPAYGYHTTTAKPQRNTNTHRTRAIQPTK